MGVCRCLLLVLLAGWLEAAHAADVLVYGSGGAGVAAAIAAARGGAKVTLVERNPHLAPHLAAGLVEETAPSKEFTPGLNSELRERMARAYGQGPMTFAAAEPKVLEKVIGDWLTESGVEFQVGKLLDTVVKEGGVIRSARFADGSQVEASVFIDATVEGDLLTAAGVASSVGRESKGRYAESLAGRQSFLLSANQFKIALAACWNGRDGELLPFINAKTAVALGDTDGNIMGFEVRAVLTKKNDNRIPFSKPADYKPKDYELFRRYFETKGHERAAKYILNLTNNLPGEKCLVVSQGPLSSALIDGTSGAYPGGSAADREALRRKHLSYMQGLLWFLTSDPGVPEDVRKEYEQWGLCKDEYADSLNLPSEMFMPEGRRMLGEYILTEHDLRKTNQVVKYDAVAVSAQPIRGTEVQRVWEILESDADAKAVAFNEGWIQATTLPHQLPYRSMLPRFSECRNLLSPVCLSATHVAYASVRSESTRISLGQAAGTAAAIAVKEKLPVHHVPIKTLQDRLVAGKAVIAAP